MVRSDGCGGCPKDWLAETDREDRSKVWLELALEAAQAATWEWNIAANSWIWSEAMWPILGLAPESLRPSLDSWFQSANPEDRDPVREEVQARIAASQNFRIEWRTIGNEGSSRWLTCHGRPLFNAAGTVAKYLGLVMNSTEGHRTADQIRAKKILFEDILNSSPDLIIARDRELKTLICNRAFAENIGKLPEQLMGKTDLPESNDGSQEAGLHADRQDELEVLGGKPIHRIVDLSDHATNSRVFDVFKVPLRSDEGTVIGILSSARDISELFELRKTLSKREQELRELAAHLYEVRENERKRIAGDIHDDLGQRLTAMSLGLHWAASGISDNPAVLNKHLDDLLEMNRRTLQAVQDIATRLRPRILDDMGLKAALEWLVSSINRHGGPVFAIEFEVDDSLLDQAITTTLFRMAEECVSNVLRHSNARQAVLKVQEEGDSILYTVEDDGIGIDQASLENSRSFGLLGMRERALLLGGSFEIARRNAAGTKVRISIPRSGRARPDHA